MNSSYHKPTVNGHRNSDARHQTRYSSDKYDSHRQSTPRAHEQRDKGTEDSAYSSSNLLINRDDIVLSYPEKAMPAKEPVISLDIEDDEERIMQADWGNESDDEDHATMQKQHKRLSTVEREEIEKADRESKGIWVRHTADDGRPYYYNSVTRESVWEIPKNTAVTSAATTSTLATNTHTTATHAKTEHASSATIITHTARTGSDRSSRPHKTSGDNLAKQSQPPRSNSAPGASTSSNSTAKEKEDTKVQERTRSDVSTSTNTNAEKGQKSNYTTKSTKMALQSSERRMSYNSREVSRENRTRLETSHSSHRSRYTSRRSRSRSPLPPPPPRHLYSDDYRYHHRSPSPPPYRHYPPYERYSDYYPYDDRIRYSPPPPLPPPDLRYRYYDLSPPPPLSPPPYYRFRERSWERYEATHRSRYYH